MPRNLLQFSCYQWIQLGLFSGTLVVNWHATTHLASSSPLDLSDFHARGCWKRKLVVRMRTEIGWVGLDEELPLISLPLIIGTRLRSTTRDSKYNGHAWDPALLSFVERLSSSLAIAILASILLLGEVYPLLEST